MSIDGWIDRQNRAIKSLQQRMEGASGEDKERIRLQIQQIKQAVIERLRGRREPVAVR